METDMHGKDAGQKAFFALDPGKVVWVLAPRPGTWLRNKDGVIAFESKEKATEEAAKSVARVQGLDFVELYERCHASGLDIWLMTIHGRILVLSTSDD